MNIRSVKIIVSAVSPSQYPKTDAPEIILVGRSNVGKSSFINALVNRKKLARTSATPGKTRTLNFYNIADSLNIIDLPGYGYAKISKTERKSWNPMIENYMKNRKQLCGIFFLLDLRREISEKDIQVYEFLQYYQIPLLIIGTKADKITKNRLEYYKKNIEKGLDIKEKNQCIIFSAKKNIGKERVWTFIQEIASIDIL